MQSKKATFKVTVKKVNELTQPKLDDAFAAKAGPFLRILAELKGDIRKQLGLGAPNNCYKADRQFEEDIMQQIVAKKHS